MSEKVTAIESTNEPHPLSAVAAVATLKRYVAEDQYRIRLHDMLVEEKERVRDNIFGDKCPAFVNINGQQFIDEIANRVRISDSTTSILRELIAYGVYWGDEKHDDIWVNCVSSMASLPSVNRYIVALRQLQLYPALQLFYAGALSAVTRDEYRFFARLATQRVEMQSRVQPFFYAVNTAALGDEGLGGMWPGQENQYTPISDYLHMLLRPTFRSLIPVEFEYDEAFDSVEYILALIIADMDNEAGRTFYGPVGRYRWRCAYLLQHQCPIHEGIPQRVNSEGDKSSLIRCGLFGRSLDRFNAAVEAVNSSLSKLSMI